MSRPSTLPGVRAKLVADSEKLARRACAQHVITAEGEGRWRFAKPGTGIYAFRVIEAPRTLIVTGDIGELILRPSDKDALVWFRRTYGVDYPLEKIPGELVPAFREFNRELAEEIVRDDRDSGLTDEQRALLLEAARAEEEDPAWAWGRAWSNITEDCEWPSAIYWTWRALFVLACLREFVRALDAKGGAS